MLVKLAVAGFLLAHAAIHAGFVSPRPPVTAGGPEWPFELRSWLLGPAGLDADTARVLGMALVALTIAGFALAAVTALGIAPSGLWPASVAIGAVASIALLGLFFHPWLVLGIAIDVALLWAVLLVRWTPEGVTP